MNKKIEIDEVVFLGGATLNGSTITQWPSGGGGAGDPAVNTLVHSNSGNWDGVYTTVQTASASWGGSVLTVTPITDDVSITTDLSTGDVFTITLTGDTLLANPINGVNGKGYIWYLKQDGSGNHAITLGDKFIIPSTATTPLAWSTSANSMDIFAIRADIDNNKFYVVSMVAGYV